MTVNQLIVHHLGAAVEAWRPIFEFSEAAAFRVRQNRRGFEDGQATGAGKKKRCDYGIPKRFVCTLSTAQEILKSVKERDATNPEWTSELEWNQTSTIPIECERRYSQIVGRQIVCCRPW